ncbi:hypothetical protein UFOVP456_20 [uncultured Caudovirales phage]|jgi:hypothetical protein|uniref:Uncharacterized protein n=1 Tax=uncultured Caudovirales phage TaxID=2100421 RepID=A0A6J5MBU2_9CAUD|nr:hypothetical protein UFOVP456_20 [uncultured Caudovirales phage]
MPNLKTVYENNSIKIVREQYYGFGCNSLSTTWLVYAGDKLRYSFIRLKHAKVFAERLAQETA